MSKERSTAPKNAAEQADRASAAPFATRDEDDFIATMAAEYGPEAAEAVRAYVRSLPSAVAAICPECGPYKTPSSSIEASDIDTIRDAVNRLNMLANYGKPLSKPLKGEVRAVADLLTPLVVRSAMRASNECPTCGSNEVWIHPATERCPDPWHLPRAISVCRMADNDKAILVSFSSRPTDSDLRAVHELLAGRPIASVERG